MWEKRLIYKAYLNLPEGYKANHKRFSAKMVDLWAEIRIRNISNMIGCQSIYAKVIFRNNSGHYCAL
jgi:hypothetical protein